MKIYKYIGMRSTSANLKENEAYLDSYNYSDLNANYLDYKNNLITGIIKVDSLYTNSYYYFILNGRSINRIKDSSNLEEEFNRLLKEIVFE